MTMAVEMMRVHFVTAFD